MKVYKIKVNGKIYEVEVEVLEKEGAIDNNSEVPLTLNNDIKGELIKSPMQGRVLSVNVNKGDKILKGDVLLILEAMKMENEIIANVSGVISDIFITEGKQVDSGEVLLVIE